MEVSELRPGDVFVGDNNYYYLVIRDSERKNVLCFLTEFSARKEFIDDMGITIASEQKVKFKKYICNIMKPLFQLQFKIKEMEAAESLGTSDGD